MRRKTAQITKHLQITFIVFITEERGAEPTSSSLHGLPRAADENLIKGSSENGNTSGLNGKELALD